LQAVIQDLLGFFLGGKIAAVVEIGRKVNGLAADD